ncbi:MAG: (E)-4-hydroxy-3-methylbut-2-enyl-diphosphate synthase [Armatimonadetes bacterium]|nr:(E)-4-hydroxy-3-methylbut-2-enyl-diphosphate synthase [Armatimonadota bacterium]MBS1710126.1 (E)-4-hydroxy-3-methylbut-2-enyl-diphosphate synthase [Armatimonadota bacterium]MBX3110016.1 (E)-4-hydroxy-3-methylbut-2-enyl-diphosphate synthase [Fimbriimonadaceae bacterium]
MNLDVTYERRKTKPCRVGSVTMGNGHPVVVQSMITEETRNIEACVEQIIALHQAGSEIVRVTTPTLGEASCLEEIKAKVIERHGDVPMTADVHHQGTKIAIEAAKYVDEIRINPGLFVFKRHGQRGDDMRGRTDEDLTTVEALRSQLAYSPEEVAEEIKAIEEDFVPVVEACKKHGRAMRIGVNHGSLSERILITYGDTPRGLVESAIEYVRICEAHDYFNLNISAKASRVPVMIASNRLMAMRLDEEGMNYPLHLGVTEAGDGQYARIKSTAGIATLLAEGIGDTIRVSLSEDPVNEIPACYEILQAMNLRKTQVEYIACPSCGRTKFDLPSVLNKVRDATRHLKGLDIAVMGCIVNGPGEMADADYGYVGAAGGKITLYRKREVVKTGIPQEQGVSELVALLKADGVWSELEA